MSKPKNEPQPKRYRQVEGRSGGFCQTTASFERVIEVQPGERVPHGAVEVPADTPLCNWREVAQS